MQFIRIRGEITDQDFLQKFESREQSRRLIHQISMKSAEFNSKLKKDGFIFVSNINEPIIYIGLFAEKELNVDKTIKRFLRATSLCVINIEIEEVTLSMITNMLGCASRFDYISDDDEVMEQLGIDRITGRWGRSFEFGDNILELISEKELLEKSCKYLSRETLKPELENILSQKVPAGKYGHPVMYMIETDDKDLRKDFYQMLLQALCLSGRLSCRRYSFVDVRTESDFSKSVYDSLYKTSSGGAIVVRVKMGGEEETTHASSDRKNIEVLCDIAKKYRNKVLTVFCFPRECTKIKGQFFEEFGNMSFVEIKEDFSKDDAAKDFLKMLAKDNHIRTDKKLFAKIQPGVGYISNELHSIFDEWYDKKLRNDIFPNYKEAKTVKNEIKKEEAKGSAYDELNEMIGIVEAKKVINQALDYFKAKKIYKDKGMKDDNPSMHMVFYGNPGSSKTTCARLFSQIMRENGLLSKGTFVELTANEMKAKYVGWTGPLVKQKFEEAEGGVLFLDEIDSLIEGHEGSFGDEAISTIVAEMENHRDSVICIFAGYPKEMEKFLDKNPGLRSRIAFHVPFEDYNEDELCEITKYIAKQQGRKVSEDALNKLRKIFGSVKSEKDFGNGRFCRNLIEKAKMAQSSRLIKMDYDKVTKEDIELLIADDFQYEESKKTENRAIGFCA